MARHCVNCEQPILPTDTVCWHCGYSLPKEEPAPPPHPKGVLGQSTEEAAPLSLTSISVYSVITLVVGVALFMTMNALGQQPLVTVNPRTGIQKGWQPFTDEARTFTLDLPPEWTLFHGEERSQGTQLAAMLAANPQFTAAVSALGELTAGTEPLLLATYRNERFETETPAFVIVGRNRRFTQATPEQILNFIRQNSEAINLRESELFLSFYGDNRPNVLLDLPHTDAELTCRQQIVADEQTGYLLVGCAPSAHFSPYSEDITDVLNSFQPLTNWRLDGALGAQ